MTPNTWRLGSQRNLPDWQMVRLHALVFSGFLNNIPVAYIGIHKAVLWLADMSAKGAAKIVILMVEG
uniref:Uncharacterized protein n=1 Tax=Timema cristinae TaxID=61476 RepID=A0A7R9CTR7_TIMCR|nr:unnamed protein product [Timema cristinae]